MGVKNPPSIYTSLITLEEKSDSVRKDLKKMDDETLKTLFHGLEGAISITWQLQADIVAEFKSRSSYGSNAIQQISKFLGIEERRAYELAQIEEQIFAKSPELRTSPLQKGHYLVALGAKRYGRDPVEVLTEAVDDQLNVRGLRNRLQEKSKTPLPTSIYYFRIIKPSKVEESEQVQVRYLSPTARIVKIKGSTYLELKGEL